MAKQTTPVADSVEIKDIEYRLKRIGDDKQMLSMEEKELKAKLRGLLEDAGMSRTLHWRIEKKSSGGSLDASAICRHFGCSMNFLSKFRSKSKASTYISKAKEPVNPKLVSLDGGEDA